MNSIVLAYILLNDGHLHKHLFLSGAKDCSAVQSLEPPRKPCEPYAKPPTKMSVVAKASQWHLSASSLAS